MEANATRFAQRLCRYYTFKLCRLSYFKSALHVASAAPWLQPYTRMDFQVAVTAAAAEIFFGLEPFYTPGRYTRDLRA